MSRSLHPRRSLIPTALLLLAILLMPARPTRAAVTLIEFKAETVADKTNRISWRTGTQIGTFGFRLWRGASAGGPWQQVVTLPAEGDSLGGASYSHDDANLPAPAQVWYLLQELANQGNPCYGPVSPGQGSRIDAAACPAAAATAAPPPPTPPPPAAAPAPP
ncbi:MAG: hypothetical protein KIS63_20470, partial [Caldilineales bacterium]|nr:hypothetical protein [Caldilineales bacterium]